jgi:hypothetical protein
MFPQKLEEIVTKSRRHVLVLEINLEMVQMMSSRKVFEHSEYPALPLAGFPESPDHHSRMLRLSLG